MSETISPTPGERRKGRSAWQRFGGRWLDLYDLLELAFDLVRFVPRLLFLVVRAVVRFLT